jgi:hypothetical protein
MSVNLANLNQEQASAIDDLEQQLGVVLVAYEGYKREDEHGKPIEQ